MRVIITTTKKIDKLIFNKYLICQLIYIYILIFSDVSNTTLKIKLNDVPEILTIGNLNYQLRGITSFVNGGELSVTSVGHYKAYCKRISSWELYDDLATIP